MTLNINDIKGFQSAGVASGIKQSGLDVGIITAISPVTAAAVFTQNSVVAAPVTLSRQHIKNNRLQAIVVNSGNANCMTGKSGQKNAYDMAVLTAKRLGCSTEDILIASTGIIGVELPMDKVTRGIKSAVEKLEQNQPTAFAESILTTDTKTKIASRTIEINGTKVSFSGCAKGSGMIEPNMATMLGFIVTDADIDGVVLQNALRNAVDVTFNSITIDGCTSTNDTVVIMASGEAKNSVITDDSEDFEVFTSALTDLCKDLAIGLVRDGEGASCLIEVNVSGAETKDQAKTIAKHVANSLLVKTAANANPPNWGRIAQAVGQAGFNITEANLETEVFRPAKDHVVLKIITNLGKQQATVYTCDLTEEYVKINEEYN